MTKRKLNSALKEINSVADRLQKSNGTKQICKTVFNMNRSEAVKEAAKWLKKGKGVSFTIGSKGKKGLKNGPKTGQKSRDF